MDSKQNKNKVVSPLAQLVAAIGIDSVIIIGEVNKYLEEQNIDLGYKLNQQSFSRIKNKKEIINDLEMAKTENLIDLILKIYGDRVIKNQEGTFEAIGNANETGGANLNSSKNFISFKDFFQNKISSKRQVKNVKILDTWLHYLLDDREEYTKSLLYNVTEKIQILCLYPLSDALALRAESLGKQVYTAQQQSIESIELVLKNALKYNLQHKVEVKWFEDIPAINAYILDNEMYFGQYFANKHSTSTFFIYTKNIDKSNYVFSDINAHFDYLWKKNESIVTLEKIEELRSLIGDKKSSINNLNTTYLVYNLDESNGELNVQTSALVIDHVHYKVKLIYTHRENGKLVTRTGKLQLVGSSNLLFSIKDGSFFIDILISRIDPNQEIIQAVYLHNDIVDMPKAAYALLRRVESDNYLKKISRHDDDVDENIKSYLLHDRVNILKYKTRKSQYFEIQNSNSTAAVKTIQALSATWLMYYPDRLPKEDKLKSKVVNMVGKGIFTIESNLETGSFKATLKTVDLFDVSGNVQAYETGNEGWYLNCSNMTDRNRSILLNLIIKIGRKTDQVHYDGVYNIKYSNGTTGCGFFFMSKLFDESEFKRELLKPNHKIFVKDQHIMDLFLQDKSSLLQGSKKEFLPRYGVYYVYHAGKNREGRFLSKSILRIYKNHYTEFKGLEPHLKADGKARLVGDHIFFIELNNVIDQPSRIGYFIMNKPWDKIQIGNIYSGVFSGLGKKDNLPMSKKIIFEYCASLEDSEALFDDFEPQIIYQNVPEFRSIDPAITQAISGKFGNLVEKMGNITDLNDLNDVNGKKIKMDTVFLESAIYKVSKMSTTPSKDEVANLIQTLELAKQHGFNEIAKFEIEVRDMEAFNTIKDIQQYLEFATSCN